jgi:hypothetical protein
MGWCSDFATLGRSGTRKSLASISQRESKFEDLKNAFSLPDAVDYNLADSVVVTLRVDYAALTQSETRSESAPPAARLAFTPTNVHIRAYDGSLNCILTTLDAVESWGKKKVRDRTRDIVRNVERKAAQIESLWVDVWRRSVGMEKHDEEVDTVLVDVSCDVLASHVLSIYITRCSTYPVQF